MSAAGAPGHRVAWGLWRMSRPEQVLLIVVVFAVGAAAGAARSGELDGAAVAWAAAALVATAVSVHLVNEYADAQTDALTTRTPFSGGSGALAALGLSRRVPAAGAVGAAVVALVVIGAGAVTGSVAGPAVVLLVAGLAGGWWYSVGPWALSRHGAGEVGNAVLGGLLLPVFGVAAATGAVTATDVLVFLPFALLDFVNLVETQWADRDADRLSGKRTLAVRLAAPRLRALALAATVLAYLVVAVLSVAGVLSRGADVVPVAWAVASLPALPLSVWAVASLTRRPPLPGVLAMLVLLAGQGTVWIAAAPLPRPG